MKTKLATVTSAFILLGLSFPGFAYSQATTPTSVSPDKKWRYVGGDTPELIDTATNQPVPDFSVNQSESTNLPAVWAPDSRRLAILCGGGKSCTTAVYQWRDGSWETGDALGEGDAIGDQVGRIIDAQVKKKGMPKGTFLHENFSTVEPQKWTDPNTLVVYAGIIETAHRKDGEYADRGFGTDLLLTLKFDDRGTWKIIKTHQMSAKEVKQLPSSER